MSLSRRDWLTVLLSGSMLLGIVPAANLLAADAENQQQADLVADLATAAQLTAFGRGEMGDTTGLKDFKCPEALVAAGGILLRAHKQTAGQLKPSDAKVMDQDNKAVAEEGSPISLAAEADALFDEARAASSKDKAALEAQIKQAQLVPERGAVGGPRVIARKIRTGKTHNLHIDFEPNSPAAVTMRGTGQTQFEVVGPAGRVLWHSRGSFGFYNWNTGGGGTRNITVRVINQGGPPVDYTVITN